MVVPYKPAAQRPGRGGRLPAWLEALPFLLPGLALFAVFVFWPLLQGLRVAFYNWNIMPGVEQEFVGLANFKRVFADPVIRVALRNTFLYVLITVPGQMLFGMLIAVAMNAPIRGRVAWRAIYYIPVLTSWVVVSYIFKYLFNGGGAPINYILKDVLHLVPNYVDWLQNGWTAQVPINLLGIWKGVGWTMVMFLAGLQSIPKELYEAAAIDGAGRRASFLKITLPMLRPVLLFVLVMLTIGGFGVGISVMLLTNGGPMNQTQVLVTYMYDQGFKYFEFGYGAAIAALLGAFIFLISFIQFKFMRGKVEA
jgi:multiple sugar transport system permease protein